MYQKKNNMIFARVTEQQKKWFTMLQEQKHFPTLSAFVLAVMNRYADKMPKEKTYDLLQGADEPTQENQ